jgi:hypothetical protein
MGRALHLPMANALIYSVVVMTMAAGVRLSAQAPVNADAKVLAAFGERVKQYADLRNKVDGGAARQTETDDPGKLVAQKQALATNIQQQRAGAKPGDIFTPDVQPILKRLLKPALKGTDGADNSKAIKEEKPVVALKVNAPYPEKEPLSMVPPDVLKQLPPLPKDLEYRFVMKHLILFDARANLVVDVLPNAIP